MAQHFLYKKLFAQIKSRILKIRNYRHRYKEMRYTLKSFINNILILDKNTFVCMSIFATACIQWKRSHFPLAIYLEMLSDSTVFAYTKKMDLSKIQF